MASSCSLCCGTCDFDLEPVDEETGDEGDAVDCVEVKDGMDLVWDEEGLFSIPLLFLTFLLLKFDCEDLLGSGLFFKESLLPRCKNVKESRGEGCPETVGWVEDTSPSCES